METQQKKKKKRSDRKNVYDVFNDFGEIGRKSKATLTAADLEIPHDMMKKLDGWTKQEERILRRNVEKFCRDMNISVSQIFCFDELSPEDQQDILETFPYFKTFCKKIISVGIKHREEEAYFKGKLLYSGEDDTIAERINSAMTSGRPSKDGTLTEDDIATAEIIHKTFGAYKVFAEKMQEVKDKGITVNSGRFSFEEDQLLLKNIENYGKEYGIKDVKRLFSTNREIQDETWKSIDRRDFRFAICRGIFRPPVYIFNRARRLLDENLRRGKYSEQEVKLLKKLRKKYGKNAALIAGKLKRHRNSVWGKFRDMKKGKVIGPWSPEERQLLKSTVKEVLSVDTLEGAYCGIPWRKVAKNIPTRTEVQCRHEWNSFVYWRETENSVQDGHDSWDLEDHVNLIQRLYEIPDLWAEKDIDWQDLHVHFPHAPTPQFVQRKWYTLKTQWIQGYQLKPLEDILTELHDRAVPILKTEAERKKRRVNPVGKSEEFCSSDSSSDSESETGNMHLKSAHSSLTTIAVGREQKNDTSHVTSGKKRKRKKKAKDKTKKARQSEDREKEEL